MGFYDTRIKAPAGGASAPSAQAYVPLDAASPDVDTSSLLASASYSAGRLNARLQSPDATPLPGDGVIWDCGALKNLWGSEVSIDAEDVLRGGVVVDEVLPADTYVGAFVSDGTPGSHTNAIGVLLRSNGTGHEPCLAYSNGTAFTVDAKGSHDATIRRVTIDSAPHSVVNQIRGLAAVGRTAAGAPVLTITSLSIRGLADFDRLWLCAGWVAGTGTDPSDVSFGAEAIAATIANLIAKLGA